MKSLCLVCGNAGVGKTTFGRELAKREGAVFLDLDTVSERLVVAGLRAMGHDPDDRDSPKYKSIYREAIHETLFRIAEENLTYLPCIIVAPFTQERRNPGFLEACRKRFGSDVRVVYVTCNEEKRKRRIETRGNPRDRRKLIDWQSYSAAGKDPGPPAFPHELVDTSDL